MKRIKKVLLTTGATLLVGMTVAGLGACKDDKAKIKYVFETNGGNSISTVTPEKGETYQLPIPTKEGYSFEGWYVTEDFSGDPVTSVVVDGSQTYYAKWEKLCMVKLNLNGGSLSTTTVYLKNGENIYNALAKYEPTKAGMQFGAWFNGETELSKTAKITEEGVELTAKWKTAYTVEIYTQTLDQSGYELTDTIVGYEYAGVTFTSEQKVVGFKEVANENAVTEQEIFEDSEKNVFKHYFDRETYTVTFDSNYPDEAEAVTKTVSVLYGNEVEVPSDYEMEGYVLAGWATGPSEEAQYKANYIEKALYKNDAEESKADVFKPERNTRLYAVWKKGYVDMFGNNDHIYLLEEESEEIYLSRGGVFFKGKYDPEDKDFIFRGDDGSVLLRGKLNENGTYVYQNRDREEQSWVLYQFGTGLIDTQKLYFDEYDGVSYEVKDEENNVTESKGTYTIDENGYYVVTFAEGEKAGETMTFIVGTITVDNAKTSVFQIRNEEEYALGQLVRFAVGENGQMSYYTSAYQMVLTGFGIAYYNAGNSTAGYYYTTNDDGSLKLLNMNNGREEGVIRLMEENGTKGYMFYLSSYDKTYTLESGDTLTLDGVCNATYQKGETEIKGYYTLSESVFGGIIVTMTSGEDVYKFLVTEIKTDITKEETNEDGETVEKTETVITYQVEERADGYSEYYYLDANGAWYAPMITLNDVADGVLTVYGYTNSKTYVKISSGEYTYDEKTGLYSYTAKEFYTADDVITDPIDIATIQSFVFALDTTATSYHVNYWYSSTNLDGETTVYDSAYTAATGEKLTLVGSIAIYTAADGVTYRGMYQTEGNLTQISAPEGNFYIELNEEEKTFIVYDSAPYQAYVANADGSVNRNEYFAFDGKGGVVYTIKTTKEVEDENGETKTETVKTEYVGTIEEAGKMSDGGFTIYTFTSEEKTFQFIQLATSNSLYISIFNEQYSGEYTSKDGDSYLTLSGYCEQAKYTSANGEAYTSMYFVASENVIYMVVNEQYRYFDLSEDKTFTVRGEEYATYMWVDNRGTNGLLLELDGYGKLTVYDMEENEEGKSEPVEIAVGTYTKDGDVYTLVYENGAETVTLIGELSSEAYGTGAINTFVVSHKEVQMTYVNEKDWSILILDDIGHATKHTKDGKKETGKYTLITSDLLYYVNDSASDACVYVYDTENATATQIELSAKAYYTSDLESLLFTQYGFAIFNGTDQYYYNITDEGALIYYQDETNEKANQYGFVEELFGEFDDEKEYEGKKYYMNSGFALTFNREEETKNDYPVLVSEEIGKLPLEALVFTPSGEAEFTVSGRVTIQGKDYNCYVTREETEEGDVEMYVMVANFRFDIEVSYTGETDDGLNHNSYKVVRMRYMLAAPSYSYLQSYYMAYIYDMMLGTNLLSTLTNTIGDIVISTEYDKLGEEGARTISGEFKEDSGMYDLNGNLLNFEEAEYEFENGVYTVTLEAEDGCTYRVYFMLQYQQMFGTYGYYYVMTRAQTLTTTDGYTVEVERTVASDSFAAGSIYTILIKQGETEIKAESIMLVDGDVYCIVRTRDEDDKITSTTYYQVILSDGTDGSVGGEDEKEVVKPYVSVEISKEEMTVAYTEDGASFVDISASKGVMLMSLEGKMYVVTACKYDEATATYTVTLGSGDNQIVYEVKTEGGVATITQVVEEDVEEETQA